MNAEGQVTENGAGERSNKLAALVAALSYEAKVAGALLGLCYLAALLLPLISMGVSERHELPGDVLIILVPVLHSGTLIGVIGGGVLFYKKQWVVGLVVLASGLLFTPFAVNVLLFSNWVFGG
jgi:hypothetical protein